MSIQLTEKDGYTLAVLHDRLDENSKKSFDDVLHPFISQSGACLLIDLSSVQRINSMGIGQLVLLVSRANTKGARVVLAAPSPFVANVLHVSKLDTFFQIAESVENGAELFAMGK